MKNKILIISGPTASGKSKLAIELAKKYNGVVINADSMQIYKGLPILSAQPSQDDLKEAEHKLYSVLEPTEKCSAGIWVKLVQKEIEDARQNGKTPIVVGGTGMYLKSLIEGLSPIPEVSESVRTEVVNTREEIGNGRFFDLVKKVDPVTAKRVGVTDKQRLMRAYEVYLETGKSLSDWREVPNKKLYSRNEFFHINVLPPREKLYERCDVRFEKMVDDGGVIEEVKEFTANYPECFEKNCSVLKTLGLAEIIDYINGKVSKSEMIEIASQKTRNYAKRQLTWLRHQFTSYDLIIEECVTNDVATKASANLKL